MADPEFPADLLQAQRDYYAADAEVERLASALPSSLDVVVGAAVVSDEQRAELTAARARRLDLVDLLYGHEYWAEVDDQHAARMALQKAARG